MNVLDCGDAANQKTYPVAELQVEQCIIATPTNTVTPTVTPSFTPTPTISSLPCYCDNAQDNTLKNIDTAKLFLPAVSPTPTNSVPIEEESEATAIIVNNNLINLNYINNPTPSSTPAPTPTKILVNINSFEIDFVVSNFSELHISIDLINKTLNVNHAISGALPLNPINVVWRSYINNILQLTKTENWNVPWNLTPISKKEFLNNFYNGVVKKRVPTISGYRQWSNQLNFRTKLPITDNINIINTVIPSSVKNGNLYIDSLPSIYNNFVTVVKLINNTPSPILKDDMWSFTVSLTD